VKDITDRKQTEEDMKRRLMKFILDDGKVYLISETLPTRSMEAFKDLLRIGYHGLALSRSPEKEFRKMVNNGHFDFIWLAEDDNTDTIPPRIKNLESKIDRLFKSKPDRFAVYINRLDYIMFKNGFKKTLNFVQRLRELAYVTNNVIILSIDPTTLNNRESRQLEVECNEIKPRMEKKMLAEEQFKILRYIYGNNIVGVKPSYTDIGSELGISKPTVRKRIRILLNGGYVMEFSKGRNKFLELTQAGKNFFVK
jgi:DNA-binding MarR family transcriptional regulator